MDRLCIYEESATYEQVIPKLFHRLSTENSKLLPCFFPHFPIHYNNYKYIYMKVIVLAENLQKNLSFANKAISSRNQLPILSHVLLEAKGEKLILSSTDLEIGIETAIPAEIEEEGAITVPARLFLELINSLPQDKISLETSGGSLQVVSKKTKTLLSSSPKDEFPLLYEEKGEKVAIFTKGNMKKTFGKILFAASIDSSRPALSGILFQKKEKGVVIVATDGYRLSLDELEESGEKSFDKLLIPARLLKEAMSIFEDEETTLYLSAKSNQIIFEQENTLLIGRTIDAPFPNYEKHIPTDSATVVQFDREELLKAVKLSAIFARESANIITMTLQSSGTTIAAKSASVGENTVVVESKLTGEENQIAFNARYLVEALANISENDLSFSMTGPLNPGVFRIVGNETFLHLIMPIRT